MAKAKKLGKEIKDRKRNKDKKENEMVVPERKNDSLPTGRGSHMEHDFKGTIKDPDGDWTVRGKMMWD